MSYLPPVPEALATLRRGASSPAPIVEPAAVTQAKLLGHTFLPGARVVDQQTQTQGTVVSSSIVHGVKPQAPTAAAGQPLPLIQLPAPTKTETVTVKLDSGQTVTRDTAWLAEIPAGLAVPLESLAP